MSDVEEAAAPGAEKEEQTVAPFIWLRTYIPMKDMQPILEEEATYRLRYPWMAIDVTPPERPPVVWDVALPYDQALLMAKEILAGPNKWITLGGPGHTTELTKEETPIAPKVGRLSVDPNDDAIPPTQNRQQRRKAERDARKKNNKEE